MKGAVFLGVCQLVLAGWLLLGLVWPLAAEELRFDSSRDWGQWRFAFRGG